MSRVKIKPERLKAIIGLLIIALMIVKCSKNEMNSINNHDVNLIGFELTLNNKK